MVRSQLRATLFAVTTAVVSAPALAGFDEAVSAQKAGDHAAAIAEFRALAEQGDHRAQRELGRIYAGGRGVARDDEQAVSWYRKAADGGDARAQYLLGDMLEGGLGVSKDLAEAARWYRKAADQNNAQAQRALGAMLASGNGVAKDIAEAMSWYRKAARNGNATAANALGVLYWHGKEVDRDDVAAVEWYRKAADLGNAWAQSNLGHAYLEGRGVGKDLVIANEWFRKGAANGNANAQLELGVSYARGRGTTIDYVEAATWFRKSAENGNVQAQVNLAFALREGRGVPRDDVEALAWYRKAADAGNANAMFGIGTMYQMGRVAGGKGLADAAPWFRNAAERGNVDAQARLGAMLALGMGVPADDEEAQKWLRLAAERGNKEAGSLLNLRYSGQLDDALRRHFERHASQIGLVPGTPAYEALVEFVRDLFTDRVFLAAMAAHAAQFTSLSAARDAADKGPALSAYMTDEDLQFLARQIAMYIVRVDAVACASMARGESGDHFFAFLKQLSRNDVRQFFAIMKRALVASLSKERVAPMPTADQAQASLTTLLATLPDTDRRAVSDYLHSTEPLDEGAVCSAYRTYLTSLADLPGPAGRTLRRSVLIHQMRELPALLESMQGGARAELSVS